MQLDRQHVADLMHESSSRIGTGLPTTAQAFVEPTDSSSRIAPLMDRADYDRLLDRVGRDQATFVVPIRVVPARASVAARFGINFLVGEENRGFLVDRDDTGGWVLYADLAGTGDLARVPPIALMQQTDGSYTALVRSHPRFLGDVVRPLSR